MDLLSIKNKLKIKNFYQFFLDTVFPKKCLDCSVEGTFLCKKCLEKIKYIEQSICPICKIKSTDNGKLCPECKDQVNLSQIIICADYRQSSLARAIKTFKYQFASDLAKPLSQLAIKKLQKSTISIPDIIIPVPLHPRRLRFRGFNQSELIAKQIAIKLLPSTEIILRSDIIHRIKFTQPQVKVNDRHNRQINLKNAFQVDLKNKKEIQGKHLMLIDDVLTTGSTLREMANELQKLQPSKISALVLARQN